MDFGDDKQFHVIPDSNYFLDLLVTHEDNTTQVGRFGNYDDESFLTGTTHSGGWVRGPVIHSWRGSLNR